MIQRLKSKGIADRLKIGLAAVLMALTHASVHAQQKNSGTMNFEDYMKALGVGHALKGVGDKCSPLAEFEVGASAIWNVLDAASLCASDEESSD